MLRGGCTCNDRRRRCRGSSDGHFRRLRLLAERRRRFARQERADRQIHGRRPGRHRVLPDLESHAAQRRHPGPRVRGHDHPVIGITFYGPTQEQLPGGSVHARRYDQTGLPTVDIAQQYDFLGGDAPAALDSLAFANSIACLRPLARKYSEPVTSLEARTGAASHRPGRVRRYQLLHDDRRRGFRCCCSLSRPAFPARPWRSRTRSCGCGSRTSTDVT